MPSHDFSLKDQYQLLEEIRIGNKAAFDFLFEFYYSQLCQFALKYTRSREASEEIVQEVFLSIWERRNHLEIKVTFRSYLYTSVKYQSFNYLKSQINKPDLGLKLHAAQHPSSNEIEESIDHSELEFLVHRAINKLPEKCRIIFNLSRSAGMTYNEISKELGISPKTVETQMTIALTRIKAFLNLHWDKIVPGLASFFIIQ